MKRITARQIIGAIALVLMAVVFIALNIGPGSDPSTLSQPDRVAIIVCSITTYIWLTLYAVSKVFMILGLRNLFALPSAIMWMLSTAMLISVAFSIAMPASEPNTAFINLCCLLYLLVLPIVDICEAISIDTVAK